MTPNPIAIIFTLALVVLLSGAALIFPTDGRVRAASDATSSFHDLIQEARDLAAVSGGATLEVTPSGSGSRVVLYSGRPNGVVPYNKRDSRTTRAALSYGAKPSFAVFLASSGSVTASQYTHGAVASTGDACTTTLNVSVDVTPVQPILMTCDDARFN